MPPVEVIFTAPTELMGTKLLMIPLVCPRAVISTVEVVSAEIVTPPVVDVSVPAFIK